MLSTGTAVVLGVGRLWQWVRDLWEASNPPMLEAGSVESYQVIPPEPDLSRQQVVEALARQRAHAEQRLRRVVTEERKIEQGRRMAVIEVAKESGAVLFSKPPAKKIEILNDLDGRVVNLFRVLRERPQELAAAIEMTPWSRQEYYAAYEVSADPVEDARRFLTRCWQAFGTKVVHRTGWRVDAPESSGAARMAVWGRLPERILQASRRLKPCYIECKPAVEIIRRYAQKEALIYADPPYLLGTRSGPYYAVEMSDDGHAAPIGAHRSSRPGAALRLRQRHVSRHAARVAKVFAEGVRRKRPKTRGDPVAQLGGGGRDRRETLLMAENGFRVWLLRNRGTRLTQRELAGAVGRSAAHMCHLEAGRQEPSVELIPKLALALDADPDEAFRAAGRIPSWLTEELVKRGPGEWRRLRRDYFGRETNDGRRGGNAGMNAEGEARERLLKLAEEALERAEKATEGPYEAGYYEWTDGGVRLASKVLWAPPDSVVSHTSNYPKGTQRGDQEFQDMEHLAFAANTLPALAEGLREALEENKRLKERETRRNLEDSREYQALKSDVPRVYSERALRQQNQALEGRVEELEGALHALDPDEERAVDDHTNQEMPFVAFGNEELKKLPPLRPGDEISCPICGAKHRVEAAKITDSTDPARVGEDGLLFYRCGEDSYLAGVGGKDVT